MKERWGESSPRKKGMGLKFTIRESDGVRVYHEKKRDGVRGDHEKKSDGVGVHHEKKSDAVRVHQKKERWGERSL